MAANQILDTYSVSTTGTTPLKKLSNGRDVWTTWFWQIKMPSGSGANTVKVEMKAAVNWEDVDANRVKFTANNSKQWVGPTVISSQMVTDAGGTLLLPFVTRALWEYGEFTFTYAGAGSRVFTFDLWVGGSI